MNNDDLKNLNHEFLENWNLLNKKLAYPYDYFKKIECFDLDINKLENGDFFSKLKFNCPDNEEIERTNKFIETFVSKNGAEVTKLHLKSDKFLLADSFEKFIKVLSKEFSFNPLYCISLNGYAWEAGLKHTNSKIQTRQDKEMILLLENIIRGSISSVISDR